MTLVHSNVQQTQTITLQEQQAVHQAFLQYELHEQVNLLTVMPNDEAVAILGHCSVNHAKALIEALSENGYESLSAAYAHNIHLKLDTDSQPENYLQMSAFEHMKQRVGWIVALAMLGIFSGLIIAQYEDLLSQLVLLAVYMPVVAAAGGNTGTQAATLVTRALAMGDLKINQWHKVLWKESRVALFLASVIALVIVLRVLLFSSGGVNQGFDVNLIALAIAVALFIQVIISTVLGGLLPIAARAIRLDPAVLVSPVLASVVDISGMWIYFSVANYFLDIV